MRAGASVAAQQTLSGEAASALKHSLSLARRRNHGQVTPLHVAATLLSSRTGVLRRACLKSQPHQNYHLLHYRALDLCFNVALNRLPATASPLLQSQPSLSNALVAALKRAQANQRRGCIEQHSQSQSQSQQQSVIAIKVDLEQLILSILDDPSVSRVMREAGFSSALVKNALEELNSPVFRCYNAAGGIYSTPNSPPNETQNGPYSFKEDIEQVLDVLLRKKRRKIVLVGDSLSLIDGLVAEFMNSLEAGNVPEDLKSAHLIKFQFSSIPLRLMKREEVDKNVCDLKRKVDSSASGGGVLIFAGDLKWISESYDDEDGGSFSYSPVDHFVSEMSKLLSWYASSSSKVWLMATASYQTYLKCKMRQPPLDLQWCLQPVSVPSGGLSLSLNATSGYDSRTSTLPQNPFQRKLLCFSEEDDSVLNCCQECKFSYEKEVGLKTAENGSSPLPFWLKPHGFQASVKEDLVKKYNKLCQSLHQGSRSIFSSDELRPWKKNHIHGHSSLFSSWASQRSIFSDSETTPCGVPHFRRHHIEFSFSNGSSKNGSMEPNPNLDPLDDKQVKISLTLGKASERLELIADLSAILQENLPWQFENIPSILEALSAEEDKFILIRGNDSVAKRRLATGIAESFFGSSEFVFSMAATQERNALEKALRDHGRLVVLIENVESATTEFAELLLDIYEAGNRRNNGGAVFILAIDEDKNCRNREKEAAKAVAQMKLVVTEEDPAENGTHFHKRKLNWGFPNTAKSQRLNEFDLDLNVTADDGEENPQNLSSETSIPLKIVQKLKTHIVLERDSEKYTRATEMFLSKITDEVSVSSKEATFSVEDGVLEEIFLGCGFYLNRLFEKWLREVLRPSLQTIGEDTEGKRFSIRLCLDGTGGRGSCSDEGFMWTSLPRRIQVSWTG